MAVLLVMGFHGLDPLSNRLALFFNGWLGVDIFFVISGFLITSLLIEERAARGSFSFKNFYVRRSLRIVPAYVVFLAVMLVVYGPRVRDAVLVSAVYLSDYDLALNFGVLSAAQASTGIVLQHTWSLAVEEQFYLLWPLALHLAGRRALPVACFTLLAVLAWKFNLLAFGSGRHDRIYTAFDTRLDVLLIGCIAALAWGSPGLRGRIQSGLSGTWTATILVLALLCSAQTLHMTSGRLDQQSALFWLVRLPLHAVLIALFILALLTEPTSLPARVLSHRLFVWVGKLSYSLYLWHHFAISKADELRPFFASWFAEVSFGKQVAALATGAVSFLLTLTLATASYYVVEKPFLRLKKRWERRSRGTPAIVSSAAGQPVAAGYSPSRPPT